MKSLLLILLLFSGFAAIAQPINATINISSFFSTWNRNRGAFTADQYIQLPKRTFNVPYRNVDSLGQMQIDPADSIPGYFTGLQWRKFVYQQQLTSVLSGYVPNSSYTWPMPGTPSLFPPSAHTHQISDVTGLQLDLNGKLNVTDTTGKWYPRNSNPLLYIDQSQGDIRYAKISDTIGGPGNGKIMTTAAAQNAIAGLQAGVNSKEPIIAPGTTAQYWRGDKTWQTLNTTVVPEGTNLYFTNTRSRSAISLTTTGSGAASYNSSTGVLNIPTPSAINFSAPSAGNSITSGVAFQPNSTNACQIAVQSSLTGILNVTGTVVISTSPTQNGTYTNVAGPIRLLLAVLGVTADADTGGIPVPAGYWVKVTYTGTGTVSLNYTRWNVQ